MSKYWENPAEVIAVPVLSNGQRAAVPSEFHIGNLRIAPATILAPMAGVTDTVFRRFIRQLGYCGLLMTEFTSADGVLRDKRARGRYLHFYEDEHPISSQLFGSNPATLAEAARMCEGFGFDTIDLNLGCPSKRVTKCNGGSGLLKDLPAIQEIFETVRAAVKIPFTCKFRMGWNDTNIVCVELARIAQESGLCAVALHARTREQGYSGTARWEWIAAIKDAVKIPVILPQANPAWHLYPVQFDLARLNATRGEIFRALRAENIGVNVHYIPVHLHPYYRQHFGSKPGDFPIAEAAYERLISLPMFHGMNEQDVADTIHAVHKVMGHYAK